MIFWGQFRSMCQWASLGETTQEWAGNKVQIYGCSCFFFFSFFFFFFLNDHHPRAHSNSECVGTGFYECVLSLGISETFLHPVRIILFTLGLQYSLLYWPKFQPFHQKSPAPEKKSLQENKTHLSEWEFMRIIMSMSGSRCQQYFLLFLLSWWRPGLERSNILSVRRGEKSQSGDDGEAWSLE